MRGSNSMMTRIELGQILRCLTASSFVLAGIFLPEQGFSSEQFEAHTTNLRLDIPLISQKSQNFQLLRRAKNLARQTAEEANGGVSQYRAEAAMHGSAIDSPHTINDNGTITFRVRGGEPTAVTQNNFTIESIITIDVNTWEIAIEYNGPIREDGEVVNSNVTPAQSIVTASSNRQSVGSLNESIQELTYQASIDFREGRYKEAESKYREVADLLRQAHSLDPNSTRIKQNLGTVLFNLGIILEKNSLSEAVLVYREAISFDPGILQAFGERFQAAINANSFRRAETIATVHIMVDPDNSYAYNNLAVALTNQGRYIEAYSILKEILQQSSDSTDVIQRNAAVILSEIGIGLQNRGLMHDAIVLFQQAIELHPKPLYYVLLGKTLAQQGDFRAAANTLHDALRRLPEAANHEGNLCQTKVINDDFGACQNLAVTYNRWGRILGNDSRLEDAITKFQAALTINPYMPETYVNLGTLFRESGHLDEAYEYLIEGQRLIPNNPKIAEELFDLEIEITGYGGPVLPDPLPPARSVERITDELKRSIVKVRNHVESEEEHIGTLRTTIRDSTGWIIKKEFDTVYILTNSHAICDRGNVDICKDKKISTIFYTPVEPSGGDVILPAEIVHLTSPLSDPEDTDLAILKVTLAPRDAQPLKLASRAIASGDKISIVGHQLRPAGSPGIAELDFDWSIAEGSVLDQNSRVMGIASALAKGNSGSPILNKSSREVVGIMAQLIPPGDRTSIPVTSGVGLGIPIDVIYKQLEEWGFTL